MGKVRHGTCTKGDLYWVSQLQHRVHTQGDSHWVSLDKGGTPGDLHWVICHIGTGATLK